VSLTESVRYIIDADDRASAKIRNHNALLRRLGRDSAKQANQAKQSAQAIINSTKTELERIKEKIAAVRAYGKTSSKAALDSQKALSRLIALHKKETAAIKKKEQAIKEQAFAISEEGKALERSAARATAFRDAVGASAVGVAAALASMAKDFRSSITVDFVGIEAARRQAALNKALEERNQITQEGIEAAQGKKTFDAELSDLKKLLAVEQERTEELKRRRREDVPKQVGNKVLPGVTEGLNDFRTLDTAAGRLVKQSLDAAKKIADEIKRLKGAQSGALDEFNNELAIAKLNLVGNTEAARRLELQNKKTFSAGQIEEVIKKERELEELRKKQEASTRSTDAIKQLQQQLALAKATGDDRLRLESKIAGIADDQLNSAVRMRKEIDAIAKAERDREQAKRKAEAEAKKAAADRLREEKQIAGQQAKALENLRLQLIEGAKGKAAAAAFRFEQLGFAKDEARNLGRFKEQIDKLKEAAGKSSINVGNNEAKDDRLLNGRAESAFQKTAEAIEAERQTKLQRDMDGKLGQLVEFERQRKNQQPLPAVGR